MVLFNIIKNLPDFFDITVVCSKGGEMVLMLKKLNKNIKIIELDYLQRELYLVKDVKVFWKIKELLKKEKFDIIHCHSSKAGVIGRLAGFFAKTPKVIFTSHGLSFNGRENFLIKNFYKAAEYVSGKCATKIVCVSNYDLEKMEKLVDKKKLYLIPNGVEEIKNLDLSANKTNNQMHPVLKLIKFLAPESLPKVDVTPFFVAETSRFRLQKKDKIRILMVGRLAAPKLPELLIEAISKISNENIEVQIVGDGPKMDICKKLANKLQMQNVIFLGTILNLAPYYEEADIFVLLSQWEGLPMTIIEAMAAKLPVLASNVGGISDLVKDKINGFLAENDADNVSEKLQILVKNENLRKKMGERGYLIYKDKFTVEKMVGDYLKLYLE